MSTLILQTLLPTFNGAANSFLFLAFLALLVDGGLVAIWYLIGYVLENQRIKASARAEFFQLIANVILIGIIVTAILFFSAMFFGVLNANPTGPLGTVTLQFECTHIEQFNTLNYPYNGLQLLNSTNSILGGPAFSGGSPIVSGPYFPGICNMLSWETLSEPVSKYASALDYPTFQADYPLVAAGVILANLTNQTAVNFNQAFLVDSYVGFQSKLSVQLNGCTGNSLPHIIPPCANPFLAPPPTLEGVWHFQFSPYAGYSLIFAGLKVVGAQLITSLESFISQLLLIVISVFVWPYLLFIGIILRATPFTRKLGGLFIAIAISIIMIFPAIFAIEYISLYRGVDSSFGTTYGTNALINPSTSYLIFPTRDASADIINAHVTLYDTDAAIKSKLNSLAVPYPDYTLNFYVEPSVASIAKYYTCYPTSGLIFEELNDLGYTLLPYISAVANIADLVGRFITGPGYTYQMPYYCTYLNALNLLFALLEAYGSVAVTAYLLPILNLIIMVVSIKGLSSLLGGDVSLAGIGRFI